MYMSSAPPPPYNEKGYNNYQGQPAGVYMQQPMQYMAPMFIPGDYPAQCVCPQCRQTIVTRTEKQTGLLTWLLVGGLLLVGCWFFCYLIPFCVDSCKDTAHYCPSCSYFFGVKSKI